MKKQLLLTLLALCMTLALLPGTARAVEIADTCGDNLTWSYREGTLSIQGAGRMSDFQGVEPPWYNYRDQIHTVRIGNGVTSIGSHAFDYCVNLTDITIPDSVTSIGDFAFNRCRLENVTIPYGVISIGSYAFDFCYSLTSITIPDSVASIGEAAFHECTSLTSVTIPNSVTSIGNNLFQSSKLVNITIPDGVTSIGIMAFCDCSNLTSVTIPNSVTSVGYNAFDNCKSLTDVYYSGSEGQWTQITVDKNNSPLLNATIQYSDTEVSNTADSILTYPVTGGNLYFDSATGTITDCSNGVTEAVIPSEINGVSVTSIGYCAFYECSSLTSVTLPNSVTSIEEGAFEWCENLIRVSIPGNVTHIDIHAFDGCSNLTSISIPHGVTMLKTYTFNRCSSLTSVTIPASVTEIEYHAFIGCDSLTDVYYAGGVTDWASISISPLSNESLINATIHYNSTGPASTSAQSIPAQSTNAVLSPQKLTVDGTNVDCEKYNIGGSNYFKLRDLAYVLNGTSSQFAVGFDAATSTVTITTGAAYTANGSELVAGVDNASTAQSSRQAILIDGVERSDLTVYNIGDNNFFQLRELGAALGFEVDFDAASNTAIVRSTKG